MRSGRRVLTMKKILIIQSQSPFVSNQGREGQELALALAAVEHQIDVFYVGNAVLQLLCGDAEPSMPVKNYLLQQKLFGLYDINALYVCEKSLAQYQLSLTSLRIGATAATPSQFQCNNYDIIFQV